MSWTPISEIRVGLDNGENQTPVGRLAIRERLIYFEYDAAFIRRGVELSPLRLPLGPGVRSFEPGLFEGLPGLFNDSLPDGWGRLLLDRAMRSKGIAPETLSALDRLAHVGGSGMGALTYEPYVMDAPASMNVDLDNVAADAQEVLRGAAGDVLGWLIELNGSSAGARPKAMIGVDKTRQKILANADAIEKGFEAWLVKFPNTADGADAGAIEYVYALMAKEAGVAMQEVRLFPSKTGPGYFATKRFDRDGARRIHAHTASGILHADHRAPSLDYEDLAALTQRLSRDMREVEKMYRLCVFNVLAYNRDDHAKNFTFLMNEEGEWRLSPAYDLTFAAGPGGEQSTMVMGEGRSPGDSCLLKLAAASSIDKNTAKEIIEQTRAALSKWRNLARNHGVGVEMIDLIGHRLPG